MEPKKQKCPSAQVTQRQLAQWLNISPMTVCRYVKQGVLKLDEHGYLRQDAALLAYVTHAMKPPSPRRELTDLPGKVPALFAKYFPELYMQYSKGGSHES